MLNQAHCSERKEGFGWVRVELRLDAVCTVLLQIEDELGREEVGKRLEDGSCFLVYLLDCSFDFMAVDIRSCMSDVSTKET